MKKLFFVLGLLGIALAVNAQPFKSLSFLDGSITSITVSNGATAAKLGGFTNVYSPINLGTNVNNGIGTNSQNLTWTNSFGIWVLPTNNTPATVSGLQFVQTNSTALVQDLPLWSDRNGGAPFLVVSNDGATFISPMNISCQLNGDANAATKINFIFVGLADGVHEITGTGPTFEWGVVPAPGQIVAYTNFPAYKFAGCGKLRLRSVSLTTATGASIGVTVQALNLNGFVP
jgi:hypothetical protein